MHKRDKALEQKFGTILWGFANRAGHGILDVMHNRFSIHFMKHLLFALLKGRPVIVYGSPDRETGENRDVISVVKALSVFVPGQRYLSNPWCTTNITIVDLATYRLIGLSKKIRLSKIKNNVSILDLDTQQLFTPPYGGKLLDPILHTAPRWPGEDTYLAYLNCQLYELAMKAWLYYHECASRGQRKYNTDDLEEVERHLHLTAEHKARFFEEVLQIKENDVEIVEYWVQVVQEQQGNERHNTPNAISMNLDYSDCQLFYNPLRKTPKPKGNLSKSQSAEELISITELI